MALSNSSKSIRVYFDDDEAEVRIRFKQLAARAETPMSRRAADLIKLDIAYWEVTGEILDLSQLDAVIEKLSNQKNGDKKETNGHHAPQQVKVVKQIELEGKYKSYDYPQVKVTKPEKIHKRYKGKVGELLSDLGEKVKVNFDGDIETFCSYEVELVETE